MHASRKAGTEQDSEPGAIAGWQATSGAAPGNVEMLQTHIMKPRVDRSQGGPRLPGRLRGQYVCDTLRDAA